MLGAERDGSGRDYPMTGVIASGLSGRTFNFVSMGDSRTLSGQPPPHDTWFGLPANNPYRQEWDSFASLIKTKTHSDGQNKLEIGTTWERCT